jgi:diguanylate cyclase (GGDEF)-like protein
MSVKPEQAQYHAAAEQWGDGVPLGVDPTTNELDFIPHRQLAAGMYGLGAVTGMIAILLPHWPETNDAVALGLGVIVLAFALSLAIFPVELPQLLINLMPLPACGFVLAAIWANGPGAGGATMASFYVMLGIGAFSIMPWRLGITYLLVGAASYAGLLIHWGVAAWPAQVVITLGTSLGASYASTVLIQSIRRLAWQDDLTGLANRRAWYQALEQELARCKRRGEPLSVAVLDLDHFKRVNDGGGHEAGDRMLRLVATAWRTSLRPFDTLARWGGDEFGVLMTGCDHTQAVALVERLRTTMPEGQTFSAGIATWDGAEDADCMLLRADEALYRSKAAGRSTTTALPVAVAAVSP